MGKRGKVTAFGLGLGVYIREARPLPLTTGKSLHNPKLA